MKAHWCNLSGNNWGDMFSAFLFRRMFGVELELVPAEEAQLFAVGSIAAAIPPGFTGDILGVGIMHEHESFEFSSAHVWGLRGKLTRERVRCAGDPTLGDLGLLACQFAPRVSKRWALGIIPHYADRADGHVLDWADKPGVRLIDIQAGIEEVLRAAAECEQIVSSSLHGCVLADSLGIPNAWARLGERLAGGEFKFLDYFSVFGLHPQPLAEIGPVTSWERPGLARIQAGLRGMLAEFKRERQL